MEALPFFVFVKQTRSYRSDVGTSANQQQNYSQKTLEVEDGRLKKKVTILTKYRVKILTECDKQFAIIFINKCEAHKQDK